MKNAKILLTALAAALVFAMTARKDASAEDAALNGTWVNVSDYYNGEVIKLDNGNFVFYGMKGAYTAKDGVITFTPTHFYIDGGNDFGFTEGWHTIAEINSQFLEYTDGTEGEAVPFTGTYTVSVGTLAITWEYGDTDTYTKQTWRY